MYKKYFDGNASFDFSIEKISKASFLVERVCKTFKIAPITKNTTILDVGCGLGTISEAFRELQAFTKL